MSKESGPDPTVGPEVPWLAKRGRWPDWLVLLPLGVLVASILVLAAYTTSINARIDRERAATDSLRIPALRAAQDMMIHVALELEGLYQYSLTGDLPALSRYEASANDSRAAAARLKPLVQELSGKARQDADSLLYVAHRWDDAAPRPSALSRLDESNRGQFLLRVQVLYRTILMQAAVVQDELRMEIDESRGQIRSAERSIWFFTLGLAALALAAALLVHRLVRRVRRLAAESESRRLEAEAAMDHRSRLLRGITHDVKNPLGAADGNAQLLRMGVAGELADDQQELVDRIRRGIGASIRIISDLLDLSRAEAGGFDIKLSPTDLRAILDEAVDDHRPSATAEGLTMAHDIPDALPCVMADVERVRQIVWNLLSNAVKYTPEGGRVTLTAGMRTGAATPLGMDTLAISVSDTGPGIQPDERERIFEEFYRSRATAEQTTGIGLGLSISRRIARLLEGDLTVESQPGQGAVFTLWLPVAEETEARDWAA